CRYAPFATDVHAAGRPTDGHRRCGSNTSGGRGSCGGFLGQQRAAGSRPEGARATTCYPRSQSILILALARACEVALASVLHRVHNDLGADTNDYDVGDHLANDQHTRPLRHGDDVTESDRREYRDSEIQRVRARHRLPENSTLNSPRDEKDASEQERKKS